MSIGSDDAAAPEPGKPALHSFSQKIYVKWIKIVGVSNSLFVALGLWSRQPGSSAG